MFWVGKLPAPFCYMASRESDLCMNHSMCYMILYFLHKMIVFHIPFLYASPRWCLCPCVKDTAGKVTSRHKVHLALFPCGQGSLRLLKLYIAMCESQENVPLSGLHT